MKGVHQHQLANDHSGPLEIDGLPAVIVQGFDMEHYGVDIGSDLRQTPLEVREERGVVEGPF
jgi:hypothetical protein